MNLRDRNYPPMSPLTDPFFEATRKIMPEFALTGLLLYLSLSNNIDNYTVYMTTGTRDFIKKKLDFSDQKLRRILKNMIRLGDIAVRKSPSGRDDLRKIYINPHKWGTTNFSEEHIALLQSYVTKYDTTIKIKGKTIKTVGYKFDFDGLDALESEQLNMQLEDE